MIVPNWLWISSRVRDSGLFRYVSTSTHFMSVTAILCRCIMRTHAWRQRGSSRCLAQFLVLLILSCSAGIYSSAYPTFCESARVSKSRAVESTLARSQPNPEGPVGQNGLGLPSLIALPLRFCEGDLEWHLSISDCFGILTQGCGMTPYKPHQLPYQTPWYLIILICILLIQIQIYK